MAHFVWLTEGRWFDRDQVIGIEVWVFFDPLQYPRDKTNRYRLLITISTGHRIHIDGTRYVIAEAIQRAIAVNQSTLDDMLDTAAMKPLFCSTCSRDTDGRHGWLCDGSNPDCQVYFPQHQP